MACKSTSQFTFNKAMKRLKDVGRDKVMSWFAQLGDPSTSSKHRFYQICVSTPTSQTL